MTQHSFNLTGVELAGRLAVVDVDVLPVGDWSLSGDLIISDGLMASTVKIMYKEKH
jgi:hypothetical protein